MIVRENCLEYLLLQICFACDVPDLPETDASILSILSEFIYNLPARLGTGESPRNKVSLFKRDNNVERKYTSVWCRCLSLQNIP